MMSGYAFTIVPRADWRVRRNDLDELARAYGVAWQWPLATASQR